MKFDSRRHETVAPPRPREVDASTIVFAPPARVLEAFFDRDALASWWGASHAIVTPRALGAYALEWPLSADGDTVLGRRGGVFRGTVVQYDPGLGFFVADVYWLTPDGNPIGPMAIEVACTRDRDRADITLVHVSQSGFEDSERWYRYYEMIGGSWRRALEKLKAYVER